MPPQWTMNQLRFNEEVDAAQARHSLEVLSDIASPLTLLGAEQVRLSCQPTDDGMLAVSVACVYEGQALLRSELPANTGDNLP